MKVTTEAEKVTSLLSDIVAAKGFEADTYLTIAKADVGGLPQLEGTVAVNLALILKFMPAVLLQAREFPSVPSRIEPGDDAFLFHQGPARGLGAIRFHDWRGAYDKFARLSNVARFTEQADALVELLTTAAPDTGQQVNLDFTLALGELFTLVVYGQLILEQAELVGCDDDVVDAVFDILVRDFSAGAVSLHGKRDSTEAQQRWALSAVRKPAPDDARFERVWQQAVSLSGAYEMNP